MREIVSRAHLMMDALSPALRVVLVIAGTGALVVLGLILWFVALRPPMASRAVAARRAAPLPPAPEPMPPTGAGPIGAGPLVVIPPAPPVAIHPQSIQDAAKDFDDGAPTVLVPKAPRVPSPFDALPQPTFTHKGDRFGLGYLDEAFGIWYLHQQRAPVELFARTQEGWAAAWTAFVAMEPSQRVSTTSPPRA